MTHPATALTYQAAHGRWREVLAAVGFPADAMLPKQQPCPLCKGTDRFQFTDRSGEGDYICRGCGAGKGMKLLMLWTGWDFKRAAAEVDTIVGNLTGTDRAPVRTTPAASIADLRRLWARGVFLGENSVADRYLASRGLREVRQPALRWVSSLRHTPSKHSLPCLLAQMCDVEGRPKQIHRTYLTHEGTKAPFEPNRMFMPGPLPKGGAIRLGPAHETLGIAEGIETALSARLLHRITVWATTSEGMLRAWVPPPECKHVLIFGDADESFVGQHAAYELARRLHHSGLKVEVRLPPCAGMDWNDVLTAGAK